MIRNILESKCPNCNQGHIYNRKGWYFKLGKPEMNKKCNHCGYSFEKEPGFFFGAMYVSYALGIIEALLTYAIGRLFYDAMFDLRIVIWIALVLIALSSFNMRLSRTIWIYLFKRI